MAAGQGDIYWIKGGTIFCLFSTCNFVILAYHDFIVERISASIAKPKQRRDAIHKITSLTDKQRMYVYYLKDNGLKQFQAWVHDDTISALANMGILEAHERTDSYYRRFTVHPKVWGQLPEPPDEETRNWLRRKFSDSHPWDPSRHSGRI